jgi:hypothetical protein
MSHEIEQRMAFKAPHAKESNVRATCQVASCPSEELLLPTDRRKAGGRNEEKGN